MMNKHRIRKLLLWLGGAVALYSVIGFLLVPALVKSQAIAHVEKTLGHTLTLGEVRINPFTLTAEIEDFDLREPSGRSLAAFQRLFVNFETSSLLRRAWTFAVVEVAAPVLKFELRPDGTHNFSALLAKLQQTPPEPEAPMPRLEIDRIQVDAGRVELADLQAGESATLHLTPISFELTELSTLPSERSPYKLSARSTDGESIQWGGEIVLNPFSSTGKLTLQGWQVATLTRILGNRIGLHSASGQVGISFDYRAALAQGIPSLSISNAQASIDDLRLTGQAGADPIVDLKRLALTASSFDLVQRTLAIESIELSGARIALAIDAEGKPNWSALLPRPVTAPTDPIAPTSEPPPAQPSNAPAPAPSVPAAASPSAEQATWNVNLGQFSARGLALDFVDQRATSAAKFAFAEGQLSASGTAQIDPVTATLNLENVRLAFSELALARAAEKVALKGIELSTSQWTSSSEPSRLKFEIASPKVAAHGIAVQQGDQSWQLAKASVAAQSLGIEAPAGAEAAMSMHVAALTLQGEALGGRVGTKTDLVQLKQFSAGAKTLAMDGSDMQIKGDALRAGLDALILRDPATGAELARLARAEATGGAVSTRQRSAQVERIAFSDAHASATLDGSGKLNWDAFLAAFAPPRPAGQPTSPSVAAKGTPSPAQSWDANVKLIELSRFGAAYTDQRPESALAMALQDVSARIRNAGTKTKAPAAIEINGRIKDSGQFKVAGNVDLQTFATDVKLKLDEISLTPAQPFLAQQARLQIVSALASADGRLRYGKPKDAGADVVFEGELGLDKVVIEETEPAQPFLALDSLRASQVKLALGPNSLDIPDLRLNRLVTKLLIAEDQSVNLVKVLRKQHSNANPVSAAAGDGAAQPAPPSSPASEPPDDAFPLSLARIRIDHSVLEFSDLGLRPQFSTRMHELQGVITGVSTSRDSRARLELDARVDEFGAAIIRGSINPFEPRSYTQVDLDFRNISMSALTPYSAKFAGYRIASGQLSMNLQYRIKNSALQGNNKIILDKLVLGERVDSPGALNLPLELAIAILKDSNGRIDIGLPVSGSLDDPQFSIGGLVWKAIGNLLTRIVTAPFRALAGLFGGGENEQLGSIEFDPGSEALRPPERQKLRTVAEALQKRPQLKLTVKPTYASEPDRAALQSLAVRRAIVTRAGIKLEPGEAPGPLDVSNARMQQAIEALFVERFGTPAARDLRASMAQAAEVPPKEGAKEGAKPATNAAAVAVTRIARAMSQRLIEAHTVAETDLAELAKRRGTAIVLELQTVGKVETARLASADPKTVDPKNGAVISDLDLDVVK
jgi:uncharacterized protein involved in outer membrane biogenesis